MTVYVVNHTEDDISAAAQYGEQEYINIRYIYVDELEQDGGLPASFTEHMERAADAFIPERDHVLIVGDHLQLIAFTSMLAVRYSFYWVLRYDRRAGGYYRVRVPGNEFTTVERIRA